jgi:hypothetical protein
MSNRATPIIILLAGNECDEVELVDEYDDMTAGAA